MKVTSLPSPVDKKKLTVLYYIDGKNNLSTMAKHSFNSLDQVGSDSNVNVVAELGLMNQSVVRGLVQKGAGASGFATSGTTDMGNAQSVAEFVEWGMKNYPAEKYALVLWNHGAGFKGILTDEEAGTICQNKDLAAALEGVQQKTGQKIDVLNFNACLMNQAEVAYEYRNVAKYMVGSEEVEAGLRIPIPGLFGTTPQHKVLEDVQQAYGKGRDLSSEELANLFVYESKKQFGTSLFTPTQAAVDLSQAGPLRDSCENFASSVLAAISADASLVDQVRSNVKKAQHFCKIDAHIEPYVDYRDLGDVAKVFSKDEKMPAAVRTAADQLLQSMGKAVTCEQHSVISGFVGRSMEGSTGLSVYFPTDYGYDREGKSPVEGVPVGGTHGYEQTSFGAGSNWEKMLKAVAKDDDLMGRYPKISRSLMSFGQISRFYGYEFAFDAAMGAGMVGALNWYPLMSFPYMLPIPGVVACAAGLVGAGLRTHSGISKLSEAITRTDSPAANRRTLAIDGAIDTAVGLGTMASCGALLAGISNPVISGIAMGTLVLAGGRLAVKLGSAIYNKTQEGKKDVDEKLAEAALMKPSLPQPAASAAPAPALPQAA